MCCKSWFHNYVGVLEMLVKALIFFPGLCLCVLLNVWLSFFSFIISHSRFYSFSCIDDWQWNNG